MKRPYLKEGRLADVLALTQVLALDEYPYRSERGLADELQISPGPIRELYEDLLSEAESLPVSAEALELLSAYESHTVLGPKFRNDMLHIAIATVAEVDVVVSWNFKHIVRLDKIRLFNAVNLELGYKTLSIYSPREVATHGTED